MDRALRTMRYVVTFPTTVAHVLMQLQSAVEQAKDEQISDFIRGQYKGATGSDIPIKDKETRFG